MLDVGGGPSRHQDASIVTGEYPLTARDFHSLADILYQDAGISLGEGKASLLYSRLAKRLRALGLASFGEYCALVQGQPAGAERAHMLAAMTTNVTRFFREPHHFEHLRTTVLPPLVAAARAGARVRLWSAACSTGPEPYSIALTLLGLFPEAAQANIRVLATDIDPVVLDEAREGCYSAKSLEPVPAKLRQQWFGKERDGLVRVAEEPRRLVSFRKLNLNGEWPMRGGFDAIFCRNVVIYFDEPTQSRIWQRFAGLLPPGGHLYIGHSERLGGPAAAQFDTAGITTYRRRGGTP